MRQNARRLRVEKAPNQAPSAGGGTQGGAEEIHLRILQDRYEFHVEEEALGKATWD